MPHNNNTYTAGVCLIDSRECYVVGILDTRNVIAITGRVGEGKDEDSMRDARSIAAALNLCQEMDVETLESGKVVALKWVACNEELPDSDTTVLTYQPGCNEPVWAGYLDSDGDKFVWRNIDGSVTGGVTHWMDFPDGP